MGNKSLYIACLAVFFIFVALLGTCFTKSSLALEEVNTKAVIDELRFTQKDSSFLKGSFEVINKENVELNDLFYTIEIYVGMNIKEFRTLKIEKPEKLNLSALETKTIEFSLVLPKNIPTDYYQMHINVYAPTGKLANKVEPIGKLAGNNKVTFDTNGIILIEDGNEYGKTEKIEPLDIGEFLTGYINTTNISEDAIKIYPEIKIYLSSDYVQNNAPIKTLKGDSSEIKPSESQKVNLNFEKQTISGNFIVTITMINDGGEAISETFLYGYSVKPDLDSLPESKIIMKDLVGTEYAGAVGYLVQEGIISGYDDGTFKPLNNITRAEFSKICTLVFKNTLKDVSQMETQKKFKDVNSKHWASKYIDACSGNQLIKGYVDNTFKPEANVTYGEALTILVRGMGFGEEVEKGSKPWPENYYQKAMDLGVICLCISDKVKVNLNKPATRGDIAILAAAVLSEAYKTGQANNAQNLQK